jgi:predicted MFS family arabinose efflux permease
VTRTLRYAPHLAAAGVGYVLFAYAAIPSVVVAELGVGYAQLGLLTSAPLLSFALVQPLGGRLLERYPAGDVLLWATVAHTGLTVVLSLTGTFPVALALRVAWGVAAGLLIGAGATHLARLNEGAAATRQQGIFGGMVTLGGAVAFALAPRLAPLVGSSGTQAPGVALAVPAVLGLAAVDRQSTAPTTTTGAGAALSVLANPVVIVAALAYVAIVGSYVTLSTFVTAYFEDLGLVGPLNVLVLLVATAGRAGGGAVLGLVASDRRLTAGSTLVAAAGFAAMAFGPGPALVASLPLVAMLAVTAPFGAVYTLAATATELEGAAIATVLAAGNLAAVVLPTVTGAVRDATGGYGGGFALLAAVNGLAALALVGLPAVAEVGDRREGPA